MPPAFLEFLKKNAKFAYGGGILGGLFVASDVKQVADADNKLKGLLKVFKDFILIRVAMAAIFPAIASGLKSIIRETGSLETALKRIQQMQVASRILAPFVGGITVARQRIAELAQLTSRGPFKFEDFVEASKSLTVFTRGAYSSTEAIKELSQVAIATGNNISDVAGAVGAFYDNLASGRPIEQSAESLRQMGVISESTAKQLDAMAIGGHDVVGVMGELNQALKVTAQGSKGFQDDLGNVNAEYAKAVEEFQTKIAMPWTETEIQNTKNYTAAIRAITPAVAKVAQSFGAVFNGVGTAKSALTKMVAESEVAQTTMVALGKAIEIVSIAGVAFGVAVAAKITPAIMQMLPGLTAMGGKLAILGTTLRGLALLTVWGTVAAGVAGVVGMLINAKREAHEADQKFKDWKKSLHDAVGDISAQVKAVQTLAEKNALLNKILTEQIKNEQKLKEIRDKKKTIREIQLEGTLAAHPEFKGTPAGRRLVSEIEKERAKAPTEGLSPGEIKKRLAQGLKPTVLGYMLSKSAEHEISRDNRSIMQIEKANNALREQYSQLSQMDPLQQQLIENEARRTHLIEQQTMGIEAREKIAREGAKATADAEKQVGDIMGDRVEKEVRLKDDRQQFAKELKIGEGKPGYLTEDAKAGRRKEFAEREQQITALRQKEIQAGLGVANKRSVAFLQAHLDQIEYAKQASQIEAKLGQTKRQDERDFLNEQLQRAKTLAGGVTYSATSERKAALELEEQKKREAEAPELGAELPQVKAEREIYTKETEAMTARATGDLRKAFKLEDLTKYIKTFEELKSTFGEEEAGKMAKERTEADIREQYSKAGNVVGYLQSIGGGGGLPQQGIDMQRRMVDLLNSINDHTKKMAEGEPSNEADPTNPAFFF